MTEYTRQGVRNLNQIVLRTAPPRNHTCRHWRAKWVKSESEDEDEDRRPGVAPIYVCVMPGCGKCWP